MHVSEQQSSKPIYKVVTLQAVIVVAVTIAVTACADGRDGLSAAMGGAIAVAGSLLYAMIVVGKSGDASSIFKAHLRAEMAKIFITAVLFLLVLLLFHSASMLWLMVGFATATLAYWLSLLVV